MMLIIILTLSTLIHNSLQGIDPSGIIDGSSRCKRQTSASSLQKLQTEVDQLDTLLQNLLRQLPAAITTAVGSISDGTAASNRDKIVIGLFCFLGAAAGSL